MKIKTTFSILLLSVASCCFGEEYSIGDDAELFAENLSQAGFKVSAMDELIRHDPERIIRCWDVGDGRLYVGYKVVDEKKAQITYLRFKKFDTSSKKREIVCDYEVASFDPASGIMKIIFKTKQNQAGDGNSE